MQKELYKRTEAVEKETDLQWSRFAFEAVNIL